MADKKDVATNRLLNLLRGSAEEESSEDAKQSKEDKDKSQTKPEEPQSSQEESPDEATKRSIKEEDDTAEESPEEQEGSEEPLIDADIDLSEEASTEEGLEPDLLDIDLDMPEEEYEEELVEDSEEETAGESQLREVDDLLFDEAAEEAEDAKQSDKLGEKSEEDLDFEIEQKDEPEDSPGLDALSYELELEDLGEEFTEDESIAQDEVEKPAEEPEVEESLSDEEEFTLEDQAERDFVKPVEPDEESEIESESDSFALEDDAAEFNRLEQQQPSDTTEQDFDEEEVEELDAVEEEAVEIAESQPPVETEAEKEEQSDDSQAPDAGEKKDDETIEKEKKQGSFFADLIPSRRRTVGIDIGSYAIKYIEISDGNPPVLENYQYHIIPEEFRNNAVKRKNYVNEVLEDLVDEKTRKTARICVTASTSEISIRNLRMPKVSKKELREAVMWSSKKSLPFDVDEAMLDYAVMGEMKESGIDKLDVLLIATHREEIDLQVAFLESIGITPERLTLDPLAIWGVYRQFPDLHKEGSVMIVELGEQSSYINFINDQILRFVREINIAGKDFTAALSGNITTQKGRINVDIETANRLKMEYGIPDENETGVTDEGISFQQLSTRLRQPLERLIQEMQRSLEYYKKEMSYSTVEQIYVTGGCAKMRNLEAYLSQHLKASREDGVAVKILDPLEYIEIGSGITDREALEQVSTSLSGPIGLVSSKHPDLNLLPERLKLLPRQRKLKSAAVFTGLIAGLLMIGTSLFMVFQNNIFEEELQSIRHSYEQIAPQEREYKAAVAQQNQVVTQLQDLRDQIQIETLDSRPLKLLSNMVPANFALDQVNVELAPDRTHMTLEISGNIYGSVTDSEIDLIEFYQRLMTTDYFNQVQLLEKRKLNIANTTGLFFKVSMVVI